MGKVLKTHQKSTKRRSKTNRFRFATLSTRIDSISIDSLRKVAGSFKGDDISVGTTWFERACQEWREVNVTTAYLAFYQEVRPWLGPTAKIVFYQKEIVNTLQKHLLNKKHSLAWKPIANLVAMLCKDLADDFYVHFLPLLDVLMAVSSVSQEEDVIESAFCSIMFLVKTQLSGIFVDFVEVYAHIAAVAHKRSSLAPLCAQVIGHVLRKSPHPEQLLPTINSQHVAFVTEVIKEAVLEPKADAIKFRSNTKVIVTKALENESLALHLMPTLITCTKHNGPIWKVVTDRLPYSNTLLTVMLAVRKGLMCPSIDPILTNRGADERTLAYALRIASLEVILKHLAILRERLSPLLVLWMHSLNAMDKLRPVIDEFRITDASPLSLTVANILNLPIEANVPAVDVSRYSPGLEQSINKVVDWTKLFAWSEDEIHAHKALWLTLLARSNLIRENPQRIKPFLDQPCVLEQCSNVDIPISNLSHPNGHVRELSLRLMSLSSPLVAKMLQIESTPADLAQYRQRLLHVRELAAMSDADEEIRIRFLLGQLHVKFALVIPETMSALHGLAQRQPTLFSKLFMEEYARMSKSVNIVMPHDVKDAANLPCSFDDEGLRHMGRLSLEIGKISTEGLRLELVTPVAIQPSNWIPLLKLLAAHAFTEIPVGNIFVEQYMDNTECSGDFTKINHSNLSTWFNVLSRAASSNVSKAVIDLLLEFVGIGDAKLQLGAIDALVAVDKATNALLNRPVTSDPRGTKWIDRIRTLLQDETHCRECLLAMSMEHATPTTEALHNILARVFYGRLVKGRGAADPVIRRRKLIFAAMTANSAPWQRPTFEAFLKLLLRQQSNDEEKTGIAFLTVAEPLIAHGMHMLDDLASVVNRVVSLAATASKRLRQLGWQRILQLLKQDSERMHFSFARIWTELLLPRLGSFEDDMAHAPKSAMMDVLLHSVEHVQEVFYCSEEHRIILWSKIIALLGKSSTVNRVVLEKTLKFVDHALISGDRFPVTDDLVEALARCIKNDSLIADKRLLAYLVHVIRKCSLNNNVNLANALCPLLSLPNAACSEAVKTQVLLALHAMASESIAEPVVDLLRTMRSAEGRHAAAAFFTTIDTESGILLASLESFTTMVSNDRVAETEPDYEARQRAISMIPTYLTTTTSPLLWRAVLNSLLFQVSLEDLSLRSHALAAVISLLGRNELVDSAIMAAIKTCFKSARTSESVRNDHLTLLQRLLQSNPEKYAQMLPLAEIGGSSEEASFFLNIYHIQKHRRARAMRRLADVMAVERGNHVSKSLLQDILIPLLMPFVIKREGAEPLDGMLQQDALNTLGVLLARLSPVALVFKVRKLLREHVTAEKKDPQAQRAVIKLVTLTVQHLRVADGALLELLLPLWQDDDAKTMETRIPLAVAVARLAPDNEQLIRGLLVKLAMTLKRGLPPVRNTCLSTLQQIVSHLGVAKLPLVMEVLLGVVDDAGRQAANSGHQKHIMLHAINSCVINGGRVSFEASKALLDGLLWDAAIGKLAGEKENPDWTAKAHEVKTQKTYEAIGKLLQSMSLVQLTTVIDQMIDANPCSPGAMQRLLNVVFNAAVHVIKCNSDADLWPLIETAGRVDALLGMRILSFASKNGCFAGEPTVPIEYVINTIIPHASKAVTECALVALNSLIIRSGPWNARLLVLAFGKLAEHPVPCLRLLSTLVTRDGLQLDETQLKCILQLTRACMETSDNDQDEDNVGICFALIRSMIAKRVLLLDIFDVIHAAVTLAVTSPRASMREQCRRLVLQFLLGYPIGDAKFVQLISSLLNNLRYEIADGRLSCAELLAAIVQRNPRPTCIDIGKWLLALVERMANESHDGCLVAEQELTRLLASSLPHAMDECLDIVGKWLVNEKTRSAAWKLLHFSGLGFIQAGHAKRLFSFCALPFDLPEAIFALTAWCRADEQFLEVAKGLNLDIDDGSLPLINLLVTASKEFVDVAKLIRAMDTIRDSVLLAQTIFAADRASVHLVKVNNLARRSQSESALQVALCMSLLHLQIVAERKEELSMDDASALSIIALIHFLQSEPRNDTLTASCTHIDALLKTSIEPIRLAQLLSAHSRTSAGKKAKREAALLAMQVKDPQRYAARKLARNRSKRIVKGGSLRRKGKPKHAHVDPLMDLF